MAVGYLCVDNSREVEWPDWLPQEESPVLAGPWPARAFLWGERIVEGVAYELIINDIPTYHTLLVFAFYDEEKKKVRYITEDEFEEIYLESDPSCL